MHHIIGKGHAYKKDGNVFLINKNFAKLFEIIEGIAHLPGGVHMGWSVDGHSFTTSLANSQVTHLLCQVGEA